MVKLPRTDDYRKNEREAGELMPCVVCGRGIKSVNPKMVHVHMGGSYAVTEDEAQMLDEIDDLFFHPIGPCCLKRHPELKAYAK